MVIRRPFAIQRQASPLARRDKLWLSAPFWRPQCLSTELWSSATLVIQRQASLIARGDKLWSSATLAIQRQASPIARRNKLWSSTTLAIQRQASLIARRDKLWSSATLAIQRQARLIARGDHKVIRYPCLPKTSESVGTQRPLWSPVSLFSRLLKYPLPSRDKRVRWHAETIMFISFIIFKTIMVSLAIQRQSSPMASGDRHGCPFSLLSRPQGFCWHTW